MGEYVLDSTMKTILKKRHKLSIGDITEATPEAIDAYNRSDFKQSIFKQLYRPKTENILSRTFIIPVTEGAITGYLFEKVKDKSIAGQNSLIVFFHDGGWILGNMRKCAAVCSNICNTTGATVLAVDYRLAPQFKFLHLLRTATAHSSGQPREQGTGRSTLTRSTSWATASVETWQQASVALQETARAQRSQARSCFHPSPMEG